MARLFTYWIVLGLLAAGTTLATQFLIFRLVDLSFVQFATLVCAPLVQAAVLAWRAERPGDALAALARDVARVSLAQPVLVLDALVLGGGVLVWEQHAIGLGAPANIHGMWILIKASAALVFCAGAVWRAPRDQRTTLAVSLVPPLVLVSALAPSTSWLPASFGQLQAVIGARFEVLQRLLFYAPVYGAMVLMTMRAAGLVRARSAQAAQLLVLAAYASVAVVVPVMLASFNSPSVTQPWLGVATLAASCVSTAVLLAAILLASHATSASKSLDA